MSHFIFKKLPQCTMRDSVLYVSSIWHNIIDAPLLWLNVDVDGRTMSVAKTLHVLELASLMRRMECSHVRSWPSLSPEYLRETLTHLSLYLCVLNENVIHNLFDVYPKICYFRVSYDDEYVGRKVDHPIITAITSKPSIKMLEVETDESLDINMGYTQCVQTMNQLNLLKISAAQDSIAGNEMINPLIPEDSALEEITICNAFHLRGRILQTTRFFENLTKLTVKQCLGITSSGWSELFQHSIARLERLRIQVAMIDDDSLKLLAISCPQLRHLSLNTCFEVTEKGVNSLTGGIEELELINSQYVTATSLIHNDLCVPGLKQLSIMNCQMIHMNVCVDIKDVRSHLRIALNGRVV